MMSDELNSGEVKKVQEWLRERDVKVQCPICGSPKWSPGTVIVPTKYSETAALVFGGVEYPMLQLICDDCGYVMLFSARPILDLPEKRNLDVRPA
jgi:RNA polymerase subunit RPABC4/transcription elongation factor Spt4